MIKQKLCLIGFLQALGVVVYAGLVSGFFHFLPRFFENEPGFLGMTLMLSLLVFSAAVSGSIVFGYSAYLALNQKIKEALRLLTYTFLYCLGIIGIIIIIAFFVLRGGENGQIACTEEAKLCSDGSFVGRMAPDCNFALCPKENFIQVEGPRANEIISSPLVIKGKARGSWFFEASFPIKLYDENGELLTTAIAQANPPAGGDWMTEDFVPFSAELKFENFKTGKGTLVLEKDNPSGLPENAGELRIPVMFAK